MDKELIKSISFAIAEGTRKLMIETILEYAGDEIESVDDMKEYAVMTDEQLKFNLINILNYCLDDEDED